VIAAPVSGDGWAGGAVLGNWDVTERQFCWPGFAS